MIYSIHLPNLSFFSLWYKRRKYPRIYALEFGVAHMLLKLVFFFFASFLGRAIGKTWALTHLWEACYLGPFVIERFFQTETTVFSKISLLLPSTIWQFITGTYKVLMRHYERHSKKGKNTKHSLFFNQKWVSISWWWFSWGSFSPGQLNHWRDPDLEIETVNSLKMFFIEKVTTLRWAGGAPWMMLQHTGRVEYLCRLWCLLHLFVFFVVVKVKGVIKAFKYLIYYKVLSSFSSLTSYNWGLTQRR